MKKISQINLWWVKDVEGKTEKLNDKFHVPMGKNAFDSLGDAYAEVRDKVSAIISYQKAIDLDKNNIQSLDKLNHLKNLK
jgi:hypothetical protein